MKKRGNFRKNSRKGSVTIEFVFLIPAFIFIITVIWQAVILGMAVMKTEEALQNAARVASITRNAALAQTEGIKSFGNHDDMHLNLSVSLDGTNAKASAVTTIDLLFASQSLTYEGSATAPIVD